MALTIQMRGNYPSIASGIVSFQNMVTGAEVRIGIPKDLTRCAPSTTSEGKLLAKREYQPYTEDTIRFLSPPFQHRDDYTVKIHSPTEKFPPQGRRLKLEVDVGQDMDYILVGRDWQAGFDILFKEEEMIIKERG